MIHQITNAILILSLIITANAAADDLFSEVTIGSVFGDATTTDSVESTSPGNGRRITGATSLLKVLQDANLDATEINSYSVVAVLNAPGTKDGTLKAVMNVNVDKGRIVVGIPLVKIDESKADSGKLLQLMNAGRNGDSIYFAYSTTDNWLGLHRTLSNVNLSSNSLRSKLKEMARYAEDNVAVWQSQGQTLKVVENGENQGEDTAKVVDSKQLSEFSLAGIWSQGKTHALKFEGNRFKLVISLNGKVSRSEGTFTLQNSQLTLAGAGATLKGTVEVISNNKFALKLNSASTLTFSKQ